MPNRGEEEEDGEMQRPKGRGTSMWMLERLDQSRPRFQPAGVRRADTYLCLGESCPLPLLLGLDSLRGLWKHTAAQTAAPGESGLPASLGADRRVASAPGEDRPSAPSHLWSVHSL